MFNTTILIKGDKSMCICVSREFIINLGNSLLALEGCELQPEVSKLCDVVKKEFMDNPQIGVGDFDIDKILKDAKKKGLSTLFHESPNQ